MKSKLRGFSGNDKADFHLAPITLVSMGLLWQGRGNNSKTLNKSCIFKSTYCPCDAKLNKLNPLKVSEVKCPYLNAEERTITTKISSDTLELKASCNTGLHFVFILCGWLEPQIKNSV